MAGAVSCGQDLGPQSRRVGDEDAATMQDEAIDGRPVRPSKALVNFLALGDDIRQCLGLRSELVEQIEVRPGECAVLRCPHHGVTRHQQPRFSGRACTPP